MNAANVAMIVVSVAARGYRRSVRTAMESRRRAECNVVGQMETVVRLPVEGPELSTRPFLEIGIAGVGR